jgi:hypothetical protein
MVPSSVAGSPIYPAGNRRRKLVPFVQYFRLLPARESRLCASTMNPIVLGGFSQHVAENGRLIPAPFL